MKIILSIETIESLEIFPYLGKYVDGIKINHLLWNEFDFDVQEDKELFVDFKLWDTPNTMKTVVEKILDRCTTSSKRHRKNKKVGTLFGFGYKS